jgi:Ca2+-binding EF-hand superfamily protein
LAAFRYFDRSNLGYIYAEDLEALIHGLGQGFSKGYVRDLLHEVVDVQSHKLTYESVAKQTTDPPTTTTQTENVQQTAENV